MTVHPEGEILQPAPSVDSRYRGVGPQRTYKLPEMQPRAHVRVQSDRPR